MSVGGRVQLVIVGHFGFAEDHTPFGSAVNLGGSGYACAVGAGVGDAGRIGIVANIGEDFDLEALDRLGVDKTGARVVAGKAPRLTITQHAANGRSFESVLGVAASSSVRLFPDSYTHADHVHLATMPPDEQLYWLRTVREMSECKISVDTFEASAAEFPEESRTLCYSADLVFMNEEERRLLFTTHAMPTVDVVLKHGAGGASYYSGGTRVHVSAPLAEAVDTTGAGEVLAGAFLSLRTLGVPVLRSLQYAVEAASAKVGEFGVDGEALKRTIRRIRTEISPERRDLDQRCG
jgi:ribokinase